MSLEPIRGIFGCEPNKISTNVLEFNKGSINEVYGSARYDFPDETLLDLSTNGLNGLDVGSPQDGDSIQIYLIANDSTGVFGFIASKEITHHNIVYPSGFTWKRKIRFAFVYNSAWDGIPNFHLSHWPHPQIRFTDAEYDSKWRALTDGQATDWTNVDLSPWLPDSARMAILQTRYVYDNTGSSSCYLRSYSGQTTGRLIGSVGSSSAWAEGERMIRTTSTRQIQYKGSTKAKLAIYVLGYDMTGPD
jgi:hypothetical protein